MQLVTRFRLWLFRTDRDDPAPIILNQRRIFILPAPTGLLFALVLTVMYAAAVNYNLGLGHALVFLLASVGHTGLVHGFRNLFGLRILPGRVAPVFAGDTAHFTVRFENTRDDARRALNLRHDKTNAGVDFELPPGTSLAVTLPVRTERRGWLRLGRLTLSTRFPLGLFHAWSYPQPEMRCLVYPAPLSCPLPPAEAGIRPGREGNSVGDEDFAGLRLRQPGDSPRHIAWKSFARDPDHRPLLVKHFAGGNEPEIWFDWNQLPVGMDTEQRLSALTGWILGAESRSVRYGLRLPGVEIAPGNGEAHATQCLRRLALFGQRDEQDASDA